MNKESGAPYNNEATLGHNPNPDPIDLDTCTLALIVAEGAGLEPPELERLIIEETEPTPGSTSYRCEARGCGAKLRYAGFANVIGSFSCKSLYRQELEQRIAEV